MVRITRTRTLLLNEVQTNSAIVSIFCQHASDNDNFTVPCEADLPFKFQIGRAFLLVRHVDDEYFANDTPTI